MASGDVHSKIPNMVPGGYGKDHLCLLDSRGGLVMPPSAQPDLLQQQQQQQQRQWIPDERDAFISWLRGEFAAANAIIDAMCHHLQMSSKPGEYNLVLNCIQARRYNWSIVLHMQQYFSVAEVNFALQQVMWQRKQSLPPEQQQSQPPKPQQFYARAEAVDQGGICKEMMINGVHDPREFKGDFSIPKFVATAQQESGVVEDRHEATGPETDAKCHIAPAIVDASPSPQPPPSAHPQPELHQEKKHTEAGSRISEETMASPSPALAAQSSYHNLVADADGNPSNAGNCTNCVSMEHTLDEAEQRISSPDIQSSKQEEGQRLATAKITKYYSCLEPVDGKMVRS